MNQTDSPEPMLSIYEGHDRELLFHGDAVAAQARGIRIKRDLSSLTLDGQRLKIVNRAGYRGGSAAFWVVMP